MIRHRIRSHQAGFRFFPLLNQKLRKQERRTEKGKEEQKKRRRTEKAREKKRGEIYIIWQMTLSRATYIYLIYITEQLGVKELGKGLRSGRLVVLRINS